MTDTRFRFQAGEVCFALPVADNTQIISELEGTTRGPYAGGVGYFNGMTVFRITAPSDGSSVGVRRV